MRFTTPKLMDCKRRGPGTGLFIVEGDSAASTLNQVRDADFQAIFPMQGKPMNAMKCSLKQLLANKQFAALAKAMQLRPGTGTVAGTGAEEMLVPLKGTGMPYETIVLLFDLLAGDELQGG